MTRLLDAQGLTKRFGGVLALDSLDLALRRTKSSA